MVGKMHKEQQQNLYDYLVNLANEAHDNVARPEAKSMAHSRYGSYGSYTGTLRYLMHHKWIRKIKGDAHHAYKIVR